MSPSAHHYTRHSSFHPVPNVPPNAHANLQLGAPLVQRLPGVQRCPKLGSLTQLVIVVRRAQLVRAPLPTNTSHLIDRLHLAHPLTGFIVLWLALFARTVAHSAYGQTHLGTSASHCLYLDLLLMVVHSLSPNFLVITL